MVVDTQAKGSFVHELTEALNGLMDYVTFTLK